MSEGQMMILVAGLAVNLVVLVLGIVGLAFKIWGWIGGLAERITRVEANVANLQEDRGGRRGNLHSTKR